jgi:hypothetical protein
MVTMYKEKLGTELLKLPLKVDTMNNTTLDILKNTLSLTSFGQILKHLWVLP